MFIREEHNPTNGKTYVHPFVPNNAKWSEIRFGEELWGGRNEVNPDAIYVDIDDNASITELGDMVVLIRKIVRFFGSVLRALPMGISFSLEADGVYWVTTSTQIDVKCIVINHDKQGVVSDACTYFSDYRSALTLANAIKFAFEKYGIHAEIVNRT